VDFLPARNKLEAVNRLSRLTNSGTESLGPGSKERKSVLVNLALGLSIEFSRSDSKQALAATIAKSLGIPWLARYESAGQTITLEGLNALLDAAEWRVARNSSLSSTNFDSGDMPLFEDSPEITVKNPIGEYQQEIVPVQPAKVAIPEDIHSLKAALSPTQEADLILAILKGKIPTTFVGTKCVTEMKEAEYSNWKQTEWQGFYFEMKAFALLVSNIGGKRKRVLSTEFDYFRDHLWDLKAHSIQNAKGSKSSVAILNDKDSIDEALKQAGIGFIILNGIPTYSRTFTLWHKAFRGQTGDPIKNLKESFRNQSIQIFWLESTAALESAINGKIFSIFNQGVQPDGSPRKPKYSINVEKAEKTNLLIAEMIF
jgi:hypothetical protein